MELEKLSDVMANEVVKYTNLNRVKTKVIIFEKKSWCNCINSHRSIQQRQKQNLEKKLRDVDKKITDTSGIWLQLFWIQKLVKSRTKYQTQVV